MESALGTNAGLKSVKTLRRGADQQQVRHSNAGNGNGGHMYYMEARKVRPKTIKTTKEAMLCDVIKLVSYP